MYVRSVMSALCLMMTWCWTTQAAPPAPTTTPAVRPSDQTVTTRVQQSLATDPRLREADIQVRTVGGAVTLEGTVASYLERDRAEQLCKHIDGVERVACELEVDIFASADERLAQAVLHRFSHDAQLRSAKFAVDVQGGIVTLRGRVASEELGSRAHDVAREVAGVVMLRNELYVGSAPVAVSRSDEAIRNDILVQYKRDPHLSRWPLFVEVHRGMVVLRGAVGNVLQREQAHKEAIAVTGVHEVDNRIVLMRAAPAPSAVSNVGTKR